MTIEQIGVTRPAAVVHEAGDRSHFQSSHPSQALVRPPPIAFVRVVRGDRFPEHRVTEGADAEPRYRIKILDPPDVAGVGKLVSELVTDADGRAFEAAPQLQRFVTWCHRHHVSRRHRGKDPVNNHLRETFQRIL
jgi:hypothetical protein